MNAMTSVRILPAALVLALASIGLTAHAQTAATTTSEPTMTEKAKEAGKDAVDATERGAKKAYKATKTTGQKAWNATKSGTRKAVNATGRGVKKVATATGNVAHRAADATRAAGNKIGEKIPGTEQNEAAKKP
ncbi:MAG: hypothetical protein QM805_05410 [Pseudomonas sp.]